MTGFETAEQAAARWGVSAARVRYLLGRGRVRGARRFGPVWVVPVRAAKPEARPPGRPRNPLRRRDG